MKKCYIDSLPKKEGFGKNKGKMQVDWVNSIGHTVEFEYDDTKGSFQIVDYNPSTVSEQLAKGSRMGLCVYDQEHERKLGHQKSVLAVSKKVEIFKDDISLGIYKSATELARISENEFGVKFIQPSISSVRVEKKHTHKGYVFRYVTEEVKKDV